MPEMMSSSPGAALRMTISCCIFVLFVLGHTQAGGLEGPGALWASLQESSFLAVVCGFAAYDGQKRVYVGKVAPSPRPFASVLIDSGDSGAALPKRRAGLGIGREQRIKHRC